LSCDLDCGIDVAKGHLYILNLNGKEGFVELIFVYVLPIFVLYIMFYWSLFMLLFRLCWELQSLWKVYNFYNFYLI